MKDSSSPINEVRKLYYFEKVEVKLELGSNTFDAKDDSIGVFPSNPQSQTYLSMERLHTTTNDLD